MIAIVDFGDSNSQEVADSLKKITNDFVITSNETVICKADKIIFPGSGTAKQAMRKIHLLNLTSVMRILLEKPLLGIGLGMQIMCDYTLEGDLSCLGIFPGNIVKFKTSDESFIHSGMDKVNIIKNSPLFKNIADKTEFYFNHSYYLPINEFTIATCKTDIEFTSACQKNLSFGVQFHPEKSGEAGLMLFENFVNL